MMNFSDEYDNYHSNACRYRCKEDDSVHNSKHHSNEDAVTSPLRKSQLKPTKNIENHMH